MGSNRKKVTLMDKQPKGVKPASVHSLTTMAPVRLQCLARGCHWESQELEVELAKLTLTQHWQYVHPGGQRPTLKLGVDKAEWNCFVKDWEHYKKEVGISDDSIASADFASADLWMCLDAKLRDNLLCSDKNALSMSEERLLIVVKKMALQKTVKSFSEHTSYKENSPTGFNANQSNQMLGTDLSETVVGYEMVDVTTGVVAFNTGWWPLIPVSGQH